MNFAKNFKDILQHVQQIQDILE